MKKYKIVKLGFILMIIILTLILSATISYAKTITGIFTDPHNAGSTWTEGTTQASPVEKGDKYTLEIYKNGDYDKSKSLDSHEIGAYLVGGDGYYDDSNLPPNSNDYESNDFPLSVHYDDGTFSGDLSRRTWNQGTLIPYGEFGDVGDAPKMANTIYDGIMNHSGNIVEK